MNQKGFANIIVIVLIVVLVGAAGYFVLTNQTQNSPVDQVNEFTKPSDETPAGTVQNESEKQTQPVVNNEPKKENKATEPIKKPADSSWKIYSKTNQWFGYSTEYPFDWSVKEFGTGEIGTGVYFLPPGETSEQKSISVVIINYKKTPPPPVWYTYTTLRKVTSGGIEILIQKREPGSEKYIATLTTGDYTAEFRFAHNLDNKFDAVFDHILSSFVWTK